MIYIRPINIKDNLNDYLECVQELNHHETSSVEQIQRSLLNRQSNIITYVLLEDEKIVATASIFFEKKLRYNKLCAHIEDVCVHKDYRNKGYGKLIVDHCCAVARNKDCYKIKLSCDDSLIEFYQKLNFNIISIGMEKIV